MNEKSLGELVRIAKGVDRSLREYARNSHVDVSIISKIINGVYVPKNFEILKKLSSVEAAPRGGVTYEQLVKASTESSFELLENAANAAIKTMSGINMASIVTLGKVFSLVDNEINRFIAASNGLIFGTLGMKGIRFTICTPINENDTERFTTNLILENHYIKEYVVKYLYFSEENRKSLDLVEKASMHFIEELIFLCPSKDRKVTIVTNYSKAYDYMLSYKDKLSYNGELSIVQMEEETSRLLREKYISHYAGADALQEFFLV